MSKDTLTDEELEALSQWPDDTMAVPVVVMCAREIIKLRKELTELQEKLQSMYEIRFPGAKR